MVHGLRVTGALSSSYQRWHLAVIMDPAGSAVQEGARSMTTRDVAAEELTSLWARFGAELTYDDLPDNVRRTVKAN